MAGDRHRGEELFQEVFLAVWVKRRQYQHPRPFKPWLYAIAVNKCRAAFRLRPAWSAPLTDDGPAADDASPADALVAAETADLVVRAVARLPEQQRAVVTLRVWRGCPTPASPRSSIAPKPRCARTCTTASPPCANIWNTNS